MPPAPPDFPPAFRFSLRARFFDVFASAASSRAFWRAANAAASSSYRRQGGVSVGGSVVKGTSRK